MADDTPHPREVFDYLGGEAVEGAFLDALKRGRLHHAWLLTGPEGVGKATFAYRAARRLLVANPAPRYGLLGAGPEDPVARQIIARAHPDLLALQREPEDGKARKGIPVEEARGLPEFFAKSPATAPYRVAIIDTADDLNASAANAVLKTLEEPPERGVLFLISHTPGALLPTLRSRCRRLRLRRRRRSRSPLGRRPKRVGHRIRSAPAAHGARRAGPGLAAGDAGALAADDAARTLLDHLPRVDEPAMLAMSDGFRGAAGAARFGLLFDRLADHVHERVSRRALEGGEEVGEGQDAWADLGSACNPAAPGGGGQSRSIRRLLHRPVRLARSLGSADADRQPREPACAAVRRRPRRGYPRARSAGIGLMVNICDKVSGFEAVASVAEGRDDIWLTVGNPPPRCERESNA